MRPSRAAAILTQVTLWVVWLLLGGRFILRALNADVTNRFVGWLYDVTAPVLHPFINWFPPVRTGDGFVVELGTLFALVAYSVLGFIAMAIIGNYARRADAAVQKFNVRFSVRRGQ